MVWLLGDFSRHPESDTFTHKVGDVELNEWVKDNLGKIVCLGPFEGHTKLDLTAAPGVASGVYYSMVFQLGKWEFKVFKADESIEVSPVHAQYYQLTMKQKEELEGKIKSGLGQAAQAIGDYELLRHDERKYQEFVDYNNNRDEHSLRAVFIDQVDVHNGDTALRNIVQRWPTIIADFMRCATVNEDVSVDVDGLKKGLGVSRAEAVVLVTKNKLYREWKNLFLKEVDGRLGRIRELSSARKTSIDAYREWLKPYITRFRLLKQAFESPASRKSSLSDFVMAGGHAVSSSKVTVWAWKDISVPEIRRAAPELVSEKPLDPYDDFVKRELVWHPKHGLATQYKWITPQWVDNAAKEIKSQLMIPHKLYYGFLDITFERTNIRLASGAEVEDGIFHINVIFMSQNALLAKLLELKAKQEEMERYVDELLGLKPPVKIPKSAEQLKIDLNTEKAEISNKKKQLKDKKAAMKKAKSDNEKLNLQIEVGNIEKDLETRDKKVEEIETQISYVEERPSFFPDFKSLVGYRGPYEWNVNERLAKYLIKPMAETTYVRLLGFLKEKFGVGRT